MNSRILLVLLLSAVAYSCSTTQRAAPEKTDAPASKTAADTVDFSTLLEPPRDWHLLDEERTQFRGVSSRLAYETLLKGKSPSKEVIVAVIDGGVDIDHEDLKANIWVNEDEIPGNGKDDDGNGYVDDVNGWNFIGGRDGQNVDHDTFELTRIYRRLHDRFSEADTTAMATGQMEKYEYYQQIRKKYRNRVRELLRQFNNIRSLEQSLSRARQILNEHYGDSGYSYEKLQGLDPQNREQQFAKNVMLYVMENDIDSTLIADQKKQLYEFARYGYNPGYSPRDIVGDDYDDKTERYYGNNDVAGPDPSHGTHVAGIIAALRNNGVGVDGVATNTKIMPVRAVPNGDERDKDVANAIRYAVENGAHVINMSFGKGYSPYKEVVDSAIKFAVEKGVLLVHGAGNDAQNNDNKDSYPTADYTEGGKAELWLSVGASSWKPDKEFVASFSNYGDQTVDVFAPGVDIYSTMPGNTYEFQDGTSMASPVVAGTAALLMAYYPTLTAKQIRDIIFKSTVKYPHLKVILPNEKNAGEPLVSFETLSASDGVVNVYQALKMAEKMSR